MLQSVKDLRGYTIQATDGEIGKVYDFYFDDDSWTIRYLVVETGSWFSGRQVLISPVALGKPDVDTEIFPVNLTRDQVENSPDVDTEVPISRQREIDLHMYYGWPMYWAAGGPYLGPQVEEQSEIAVEEAVEPHIRSCREVTGYHIKAIDGDIGHVHDFLIDDEKWEIRYMVVDTRNWWPGKAVLVSPQWIEDVSWEDAKVSVDLTRESIRNSPEYENLKKISREYEEKLYEYYQRRKYWK
jgi:sporulation protein YlmC with PRC-barrel domain